MALSYRVNNSSDPICDIIPPIEYEHIGHQIHLGQKDWFPDVPMRFDIWAHAHWNYVKNLIVPDSVKRGATDAGADFRSCGSDETR